MEKEPITWADIRDFIWEKFTFCEPDNYDNSIFGDIVVTLWSPWKLPQKVLRRTYLIGIPFFLPLQILLTILTYVVSVVSTITVAIGALLLLVTTFTVGILVALWMEDGEDDVESRFSALVRVIFD